MLPPFLLLLVGMIGLVWAIILFRNTGLIGGCLATLLAGSVFGYEFFHAGVVTSDRMLLALLAVMYFMHRNLFGLPARRVTRTDVVTILSFGALFGSTFSNDWQFAAYQPAATLLFFYAMPVALYWIASRCPVSEQAHGWIFGFFAVFGCYLSLTGICEVLELTPVVFPRYISNPDSFEFLGRARGPFLNPIGNGMYIIAGLLATLMWWPYVKKAHRPIVLGVAGLHCVGAICTMTRSVWLGAGVALVGIAALIVPKQHRLRVVFAAVLCGGVFLGVTGKGLLSFKRDKHLTAKETEDSAKLRPILAAFAFEMFRDNPVYGVGFGQYKRRNVEYLTSRRFDLPMAKAKTYVQHNVFLSILVESGLIGLLLFLLMLGLWSLDSWSLWAATELPLWQRQIGLFCLLMIGAYVPNGMFHEMSLIPMLNMLLFFGAGLTRNMHEQFADYSEGTPVRGDARLLLEQSRG